MSTIMRIFQITVILLTTSLKNTNNLTTSADVTKKATEPPRQTENIVNQTTVLPSTPVKKATVPQTRISTARAFYCPHASYYSRGQDGKSSGCVWIRFYN